MKVSANTAFGMVTLKDRNAAKAKTGVDLFRQPDEDTAIEWQYALYWVTMKREDPGLDWASVQDLPLEVINGAFIADEDPEAKANLKK